MKNLRRKYSTVALLLLLLLSAYRCAHKVAPTGGPPDTTPPEVEESFPQQDSVRISDLKYIQIRFSEAIQQSSLNKNYWLIPELPGGLKPEWKGSRTVRFLIGDSLEKNRTYVFTLGTGVSDLHRNGLAEPFQLAFSTGAVLDSGSISGKIYADSPQKGLFVNAYQIDADTNMDSLLYKKARYFTQINDQQEYVLNYLSPGTYRLIALRDENFNRVYNIGTDLIGFPFEDIKLDSSNMTFRNINFFVVREDTIPPRLSAIDTVSTQEIDVSFNEGIAASPELSVLVTDTSATEKYFPLGISFDRADNKKISAYFSELPPRVPLVFTATGVRDIAGNYSPDSLLVKEFTSAATRDTIPPKLTAIVPPDNSDNVAYDASVDVTVSAPVDTNTFRKAFRLTDEKNRMVSGSFDFLDLRHPRFKPGGLLEKEAAYFIEIHLDSMQDVWQRSFPDTTLSSKFNTRSWTDLGEISGTVFTKNPVWQQVIVQAKPVRGQQVYQVVSPANKEYTLENLPAGPYLLDAVVDVNKNGEWDRGSSNPWHFAEPFLFKPDTVTVRKRWTTQGINFNFDF